MKLAIFLATGFEEAEAILTIDILRRAGIEVDIISVMNELLVTSSHNIGIQAEILLTDLNDDEYEGFILPGGSKGVENLAKNEKLLAILNQTYQKHKLLAAVCAAPQIFGQLGFVDGKEVTSYPGCVNGLSKTNYNDKSPVSVSDNIITGASVGSTVWFALAIVKTLLNDEIAEKIEKDLVIRNKK